MCNLDVHLLLKDRDGNKVIEYNSINADGQQFSIDLAKSLLEQFKEQDNTRNFRRYTDYDYDNLKTQPRGADNFDIQDQMSSMPEWKNLLKEAASLPLNTIPVDTSANYTTSTDDLKTYSTPQMTENCIESHPSSH